MARDAFRAGRPAAAGEPAAPAGLIAGLLMAAVLAAYWPALECGFIWDDDDYVTANSTLVGVDGLRSIWFDPGATPQYYPLVFTSFWVERQLWGLSPKGYHATNLLLHGLSSILLWRVLRRLDVPWAWFAAGLFALHPVQVESVAWITERKNVLSGLFYFLSADAYLRFALDESTAAKRRWATYAAAVIWYVAALLSKTVTFSLPAALAVVLWWRNGRLAWRDIRPLVPFVALAVAPVLATIWIEKQHVGAAGADFQLTLVERWIVAGRALWFYAAKLLLPRQLTFVYPRWDLHDRALLQLAYPIAALAGIVALWLARKRIGRGPLAAVLCFAGTLFPALGFFDVYPMRYSFVADHFQYLASVGILTLMGAGLARVAASPSLASASLAGRGLAAALLVGLGCLTWQQIAIYRDLRTLWTDTLAKNPTCWMAYNNLAALDAAEQRWSAAERKYQESLRLHASNAEALIGMASLMSNQNRFDDAEEYFDRALAVDPSLPVTHFIRGLHWGRRGQLEAAAGSFRRATELNPRFEAAWYYLGRAHWDLGQKDEAESAFRRALQANPRHAQANLLLGIRNLEQEQFDAAVDHLRRAVEGAPDSQAAHANLAIALRRKGLLAQAEQHERRARELKPR